MPYWPANPLVCASRTEGHTAASGYNTVLFNAQVSCLPGLARIHRAQSVGRSTSLYGRPHKKVQTEQRALHTAGFCLDKPIWQPIRLLHRDIYDFIIPWIPNKCNQLDGVNPTESSVVGYFTVRQPVRVSMIGEGISNSMEQQCGKASEGSAIP